MSEGPRRWVGGWAGEGAEMRRTHQARSSSTLIGSQGRACGFTWAVTLMVEGVRAIILLNVHQAGTRGQMDQITVIT